MPSLPHASINEIARSAISTPSFLNFVLELVKDFFVIEFEQIPGWHGQKLATVSFSAHGSVVKQFLCFSSEISKLNREIVLFPSSRETSGWGSNPSWWSMWMRNSSILKVLMELFAELGSCFSDWISPIDAFAQSGLNVPGEVDEMGGNYFYRLTSSPLRYFESWIQHFTTSLRTRFCQNKP